MGLVYEYVPGQTQDLEVAQVHLDFFYEVGFVVHPLKPDNWHSGRLIDLSDAWSVLDSEWKSSSVHHRDATKWFWTLGFKENSAPVKQLPPLQFQTGDL